MGTQQGKPTEAERAPPTEAERAPPTEAGRAAYWKRCSDACVANPKLMLDFMNQHAGKDPFITLDIAKELMNVERYELFELNNSLFPPYEFKGVEREYYESLNRLIVNGKIPNWFMARVHPNVGKPVYLRGSTYSDRSNYYLFVRRKEVDEWRDLQDCFAYNRRKCYMKMQAGN